MVVRKRDSVAWRWKNIGVGWYKTAQHKVEGYIALYRRQSGIYLRIVKLGLVWIKPGHKWNDRWTYNWPKNKWI